MMEWTGRKTYQPMKAATAEGESWKSIVKKYRYEADGRMERMCVDGKLIDVNLRFEVDK